METVKEVVRILDDDARIMLAFGGNCIEYIRMSPMEEAFGEYMIDKVYSAGDGRFEIMLKQRLMKSGEVSA